MDVELVDLGEVGKADFGQRLFVCFQLGLQAFSLLLAHIVQSSLELELPHRDLQLLPRLIDEFSNWSGILLLLLESLGVMGVVVIMVVMLVFIIQFDVEDVDSPIS